MCGQNFNAAHMTFVNRQEAATKPDQRGLIHSYPVYPALYHTSLPSFIPPRHLWSSTYLLKVTPQCGAAVLDDTNTAQHMLLTLTPSLSCADSANCLLLLLLFQSHVLPLPRSISKAS